MGLVYRLETNNFYNCSSTNLLPTPDSIHVLSSDTVPSSPSHHQHASLRNRDIITQLDQLASKVLTTINLRRCVLEYGDHNAADISARYEALGADLPTLSREPAHITCDSR